MAQQSFLDKVREWIGGIAWSIFLWSARMTEEEYFDEQTRVAEQRDEAAASEHLGAEKSYSTKALLRDLTNALENGYETLGDTDIGDLLLDCEADDEGQQLAPS